MAQSDAKKVHSRRVTTDLGRKLSLAKRGVHFACSQCGGIGRRGGFKIRFFHESVGSIPSTGTTLILPLFSVVKSVRQQNERHEKQDHKTELCR